VKLNTGIIAHSLPFAPAFLCGSPDHTLSLSDVRFLPVGTFDFSEDILYFADWETLRAHKGGVPAYLICVGGGDGAASFFKEKSITGFVTGSEDPIGVFSAVQSIFLRFNQLENRLLTALQARAPTRDIMICCAEFFQAHVILYDNDRKLIDYSTRYLPDDEDPYWKEALETGRRSEKMVATAKIHNIHLDAIRTPTSDYVNLGPGLPKILTHSFFESGKRLATLTVAETAAPLSVFQLKLLDYIAGLLSPNLLHIYSSSPGVLESLRGVLASMLDKENIDPLILARCVGTAGWSIDDDYLLMRIKVPKVSENFETLTRYRHIYERIFPESVVFQYKGSLVLVIHGDTGDVMAACLPNLEKQLNAHDAVCGLSFPFKGILQLEAQYSNSEMAIQYGNAGKRIRRLSDAITVPIISRIATELPLYPLCHREAVRIFDYDQQNGTELLLTLEAYLMHYKSLKAAAESLYIHRNTMTYRLGYIEKIARLALDDPQERLHLLLSCIVLRTLGAQKP
jgi:hypothetical protein